MGRHEEHGGSGKRVAEEGRREGGREGRRKRRLNRNRKVHLVGRTTSDYKSLFTDCRMYHIALLPSCAHFVYYTYS